MKNSFETITEFEQQSPPRPTMSITFDGNGDPVECPKCKSRLLHHARVVVRSRIGEDKPGIEVIINEGAVQLRTLTDQGPKDFAGRRDDFRVEFWCEECHQSFALNVAQHKGATLASFEHLGRPKFFDEIYGVELRRSAVSIVEQDGKYLCAWNQRFDGWALPGGMVETDETLEQAQARELREETRLVTLNRELVFEGTFELPSRPDRSSHVHVFRVTTVGTASAGEKDCPIAWLTREELLQRSPFATFYETMFAKLSEAPA